MTSSSAEFDSTPEMMSSPMPSQPLSGDAQRPSAAAQRSRLSSRPLQCARMIVISAGIIAGLASSFFGLTYGPMIIVILVSCGLTALLSSRFHLSSF